MMEKFKIKEKAWLIVGVSIGVVAIITGVSVYCGIYLSTPNYLLIKNNEVVIDLPNYDNEENINKEKYYTLGDTNIISFETISTSQSIININMDELFTSNSSYSTFELNIYFTIEASVKDLNASELTTDGGFKFLKIDDELETTLLSQGKYSTYPNYDVSLKYTVKNNEKIDALQIEIFGELDDLNKDKVSDLTLNQESFYFYLLGV